ncbi:MAG: hypothetical protein FJ297_18595 [Planctomycetes bacterium]|nr:hypothetical protein [Planctomycetota bacterium]
MDSSLIMQIVLAVLVLTALVVGGFSVKTRRAWDVVAGFLVFISACVLLIFLSMSLKARRTWLKKLDGLEVKMAQLTDEHGKLLYGDLTEVSQQGGEDSVQTIGAKLGRLLLDRGRTWRQSVPSPLAADGTIIVNIATAAAGRPHQIPVNFIIHAFRESDHPAGYRVPATYLGEFQVVAVTETSVQLRATLQSPDLSAFVARNPTANFADAFNNTFVSNATWSLYEILPVDDHRVFAAADSQPDLVAPAAFGAPNEAEISQTLQFIAERSAIPPSPESLQAIADRYRRDGRRSTNEDPPEFVYATVRFTKEYAEKVDSDAPLSPLNSEFFDASGQAQVPFLQRGEGGSVTIKADTVGAFPLEQANQLTASGSCELVDRIYVRKLHDFASAFHALYDQYIDISNKSKSQAYNRDQLDAANKNLTLVIQKRQDERSKVETDLGFVKQEADRVKSLVGRLQQDLSATQDHLRTLFRANLALEQELAGIEKAILDRAQREVERAVASP